MKPVNLALRDRRGYREQVRIGSLQLRNSGRFLHHPPDGCVVETVGCGARGALADQGANRHHFRFFLYVLVNDIIRETRQRLTPGSEIDFDLVGRGEPLYAIKNLLATRTREQRKLRHKPPRSLRYGSAMGSPRGQCPWSAAAGLCRSSACPTGSS